MDIVEVEENLFAASDATLHGEMYRMLASIYCKILSIFPALEAARPRSKSGIQALCSLHITLEKTNNILQHCCQCSKLYLAITSDSILLKFEKAKTCLVNSLKHVEDIASPALSFRILEIVNELEATRFSLDPLEKQVGDEIIMLLQQERKLDDSVDTDEVESFHQTASTLGINSLKAALTERRALKKLLERARLEEDKRKESIVTYLLFLMRKYSKLFRNEFPEDSDSQVSTPCSPIIQAAIEDDGLGLSVGQLSKLSSFQFEPHNGKFWQVTVPPEEFRCPISLQLMYDPVIISSGQTYERICIEKWFNDGHDTCPKTQQKLSHLCLTPNYCVKGLITSWCEQNGVPVPDAPPASLDLNNWKLSLLQIDSENSVSIKSISSATFEAIKEVPLEDHNTMKKAETNEEDDLSPKECSLLVRHDSFLRILNGEDLREKCRVVEQIRLLVKDDEEARVFLGCNGFVEALLCFLADAIHTGDVIAQEIGAMALFNMAINNNRNKQVMLDAGVIPLLEKMVTNQESQGSATALYVNLSCLCEAKPVIGSSKAVPFLVAVLKGQTQVQCRLDALHALYNLSSHSATVSNLLSAGLITTLLPLLSLSADVAWSWTEKSLAVLINLASSQLGKDEMASSTSLIAELAMVLDSSQLVVQEQAASCLYLLCVGNEKCTHLVLQEGVIPALVSISMNGTSRGKEKAQKLLVLFREQRQRDQASADVPLQRIRCNSTTTVTFPESQLLSKPISKRKMSKALSIFSRRSHSLRHC